MTRFARTDTSILGHWWWTIDRWTMAAVALLIVYGVMLTMAASPPVAERLHYEQFHFVRRQLVFLPVAIAIIFAVSLMTPRNVLRLSLVVFAVGIVLMVATLFFGADINGARRWISIAGMSLQPSEFIKPSLAVMTAWAFARQHKSGEPMWRNVAIGLYVLVVALLLLQPDFGMTVVVSAVWFAQVFLAGLPILWVVGDRDRVVHPDLIRISHELTPGSRFAIVEGAGHSAYFERAEAWNAAVLGFIDGVEERPTA